MDEKLIAPDKTMLSYSSYLKVDELLNLQAPLSSPIEHDEMLFIIIHQVYELWFKQSLHEIEGCEKFLAKGELMRVMAGIKRLDAIQRVMIQQIDVLETMAPDDFARFRDHLNPASGFQSFQFRLFEFRMGLKDEGYLRFYQANDRHVATLKNALAKPTFYDHFLRFLKMRGYEIPQEIIERDFTKPYEGDPRITSLFETIYRNPYQNSDIYLALESLMDLEQNLSLWRFRHKSMVERIIGNHRGTGGSSGAKYLEQTLTKRCFPEIWDVRNRLGKTYN